MGGLFGGEWIHVYVWLSFDQTPVQNKKKIFFLKCYNWDFLGGPVAETTAPNAGDMSSIPGQETRSCVLQLRPNAAK